MEARNLDRKKIISYIAVASACVLGGLAIFSWVRRGKKKQSERDAANRRSTTLERRRRDRDDDEVDLINESTGRNRSIRTDRVTSEAQLPGMSDSLFRSIDAPYRFEVRRGRIDRRDLLLALNLIRRLSEKHLAKVRRDFRAQRRKNYHDLEIYRQLIAEFAEQTEFLLSETSSKVFADCGITQDVFETSLSAYGADEQVLAAVNSLGVARKVTSQQEITKKKLLQILQFSAAKRDEIMATAPLDAAADVGFLHTRLEDEVQREYKLEPEEIAASFERFKCESDPEFRAYLEIFGRR